MEDFKDCEPLIWSFSVYFCFFVIFSTITAKVQLLHSVLVHFSLHSVTGVLKVKGKLNQKPNIFFKYFLFELNIVLKRALLMGFKKQTI